MTGSFIEIEDVTAASLSRVPELHGRLQILAFLDAINALDSATLDELNPTRRDALVQETAQQTCFTLVP